MKEANKRRKKQKHVPDKIKEDYPKKMNGKMIEWGRLGEDASIVLLCF